MNENLTSISTTPDFLPVSFNIAIGVNTIIDGYWMVIFILFVYSRFKDNYRLALSITNFLLLANISCLAIIILFYLVIGSWSNYGYATSVIGGFSTTLIGVICICVYFSLFINKLRGSIYYCLVVAILSFLPLAIQAWTIFFNNNSYLPMSYWDLYAPILDKLDAGLIYTIILLTILLFIKIYNILKLRFSTHK